MEKTDSALTAGFCSVVVITFALHAEGPRFKTVEIMTPVTCSIPNAK